MSKSKATLAREAAERAEAQESMREYLSPGDRMWTILRHVSAQGTLRCVSLIVVQEVTSRRGTCMAPIDVTWQAALATGYKINTRHGGIAMDGGGMDMGFALVYNLSRTLWPDGYPCTGENCASNDHTNGECDRTPGATVHRDGGYALRHDWL